MLLVVQLGYDRAAEGRRPPPRGHALLCRHLRPNRARHRRLRCHLLGVQAVLRVRVGRRPLPAVRGRRHDGAPGRAAPAPPRAQPHRSLPAHALLRRAQQLRQSAGRRQLVASGGFRRHPDVPVGQRGPAPIHPGPVAGANGPAPSSTAWARPSPVTSSSPIARKMSAPTAAARSSTATRPGSSTTTASTSRQVRRGCCSSRGTRTVAATGAAGS